MRTDTLAIAVVVAALLGLGGTAWAQLKAFPSAEGFGANSLGGRGGRVIRVTNLDDSGPGSFREAVMATGPRFVVFDVSGTINLQKKIALTSAHSYLYIAGQTSPGGVQLKGIDTYLSLQQGIHDVIIRHLRIRPGGPTAAANTANVLIIYGNTEQWVYNIIIDHCDLMWGGDEMSSTSGLVKDVTWQWNIIAEGLAVSPGSSFGSLADNYADAAFLDDITFSYLRNLYAHNANRSPLLARSGVFDFRNNVVYNWLANNALSVGKKANNHSAFGNFVNNHYIAGVSGTTRAFFLNNGSYLGSRDRGGSKIYAAGNWSPACPSGCTDDWDNGYVTIDHYPPEVRWASEAEFRVSTPFSVPNTTTDPVAGLKEKILATVGASKPSRDNASQRIVDHVRNLTGDIRSDSGGPWPNLIGGPPPSDADNDGMADAWETLHGLNPNDPSDANRTAYNDWTNIENYLNELAGDPIDYGFSQRGEPAFPRDVSIVLVQP